MTVVWIIVAVVVVVAVVTLVVLHDRRRARTLAHLHDGDPTAAGRAAAEADAEHSRTEGLARAAHQGITGAGGMTPGA